jgi:type I restriction enzyme S subunit
MTEGPYKLPPGWRWVRIGDVANFFNGYAFKPTDWKPVGRPIIRIQNLTYTSNKFNYYEGTLPDRYLVRNGDLLVAWSASLGVFIWHGEEAFLNQHIFKVTNIQPSADKDYLYYALQKSIEGILERTHGSAMKHVTRGKFLLTEIPLPPFDEQQRIAAKVEVLMDRVREAKRLRTEARHDAERLMQSALGEIFINCKKIGWGERCIGDVLCEKPQYGLSKKAFSEPAGIPIIRMGNIVDGKVSFDNLKYVELKPEETTKYLLEEGDILFNKTNSAELVGKSAVYENTRKAVFASYLIRLKIDNAKAMPHYIVSYINSQKGQEYIQSQLSRAIGQANLNANKLQAMPIHIPPLDEQRRIMAYLDKVQQQVNVIKRAQRNTETELKRLEQAILDMAFHGEL